MGGPSLSLRQDDSLDNEMATHSIVLAWMDKGAWWAEVHGVTKSQTQLSTQEHKEQALVVEEVLEEGMGVTGDKETV